MTDLDDEGALRTALRTLADDAPAVGADLPRIRRGARRHRVVRAAAVAAATAAAVVAVPLLTPGGPAWTSPPVPPATSEDAPRPADPAPVLTALPDGASALFAGTDAPSTIARTDRDAAGKGWAVVVRAVDGDFGRDGAVVTYPVEAPRGASLGEAVPLPSGVVARTVVAGLTWPVGGGWARIRGDLSAALLARLAASVTVVGGRPSVTPPAGYRVVVTTPAVPALVAEARYLGGSFAQPDPSGRDGGRPVRFEGLVFTQVLLGAGLEDVLYEEKVVHRVQVRPVRLALPVATSTRLPAGVNPAVDAWATNLVGGNGDVLWELRPGVVAVVGVSGSTPPVEQVALASRLVDATQWRATQPQEIVQDNGFGP